MDNIKNIQDFLSKSRLLPYLDYCNNNYDMALRLYQMNLRLNAAFMPILSMLEVSLRNSLDKIMTSKYPLLEKDNWLSQLKLDINTGVSHNRLNKSDFSNLINNLSKVDSCINNKIDTNIHNYLKRVYRDVKSFKEKSHDEQELQIREEIEKIKATGEIKIKQDIIVTNMNFSFWTGMFDIEPYKFFESEPRKIRLLQIFDTGNRKIICDKLFNIRNFRNRVAHNESSIFVGQKFDAEFAKNIRNDIMFLLRSLEQNLEIYSEDIYLINSNLVKIEDYCENILTLIKR